MAENNSGIELIKLREKFYGCICGAHIGSSMGAVVEGWPYESVEKKYGTLEELLPYEHYNNGWVRDAGTTEDGIERQKLMITAIIKKGGRVNAEDVRAVWRTEINPKAPGNVSEPFEGELLAIAKSKIPARDIGKYCDYAGLNSFARACHPIGLINAGDPASAAEDIFEVGQLYQTSNSRGLKWACVTAVGIAAATKSNATVDSVIADIFKYCDSRAVVEGRENWYADYAGINIIDEIEAGLRITEKCKDFKDLRKAFDSVYNGTGMPYCMSYANEVVTKAVCIFKLVNGNLKQAIIAGVNLGRDTDCVTAIAAGISGALTGTLSIPAKWIEQVDSATKVNPFTNTQRTMRENSDGLYNAFKNRLDKIKEYYDKMYNI
ncbi:MAG: ADP-ribosylglycohydrolase family protein [Oscillospiraceae bacterium]|nr:ADP-ribosylglycohydrolase family protein [Oscillospiraceae bacterium]